MSDRYLAGVVAQLLAVQQVLRGEAAADEGGVVQLDVGHGHFDALVIGFLQDGDGGFFGVGGDGDAVNAHVDVAVNQLLLVGQIAHGVAEDEIHAVILGGILIALLNHLHGELVLEDDTGDGQFLLLGLSCGGSFGGSLGFGLGGFGCCGGLGRAAAGQHDHCHAQCEEKRYDLFHFVCSFVFILCRISRHKLRFHALCHCLFDTRCVSIGFSFT